MPKAPLHIRWARILDSAKRANDRYRQKKRGNFIPPNNPKAIAKYWKERGHV